MKLLRESAVAFAAAIGSLALVGSGLTGVSAQASGVTTRPAATAVQKTSGSVDIGTTGPGYVVVDEPRRHVFVSAPHTNEVVVLSYTGSVVTRIANEPGASGMVMVGDTLYVAQSAAGAIDRISITTLTSEGILATGLSDATVLAFTGGLLWEAPNPLGGWGSLSSISLVTGAVTHFPTPTYYGIDLATSPGAASTLFLAEDGLSPGTIYRLDVSSGAPKVAAASSVTNLGNIEGLTVSSDGTRVIPASGAPYEFEEFSATTLQLDGVIYPGQPYPSAVGTASGDGGLFVGGLNHGYSNPDISVYPLGQTIATFTASTNPAGTPATVMPHGLSFGPRSEYLFALTAADGQGISGDVTVYWYRLPTPVL